jgi:hypothetical protein
MKVYVLWENSTEQYLAANLVAVLRKIGAMLVYGKVNNDGVLLEDWQSKPKVKMECFAGQSPSVEGVEFGPPATWDGVSFSGGTVAYTSGVGGYGAGGGVSPQPAITRAIARELVRMFPDEGTEANAKQINKTKPVVPKPNTTETGVTVRQLDMWDEGDDHA